MTELHSQVEETLRQGFKYFNRFMLASWRLGLGPLINWSPAVGGRIMVITHTGRKTGMRRQTPLNYTEIDGDIYCVAGYGQFSDWYRNLLANPRVEIWLPNAWWTGVAEDVTGEADHLEKVRQVLIASGFAAYAAGINPRSLSDDELAVKVESYRLIRIRRGEARTGSGGPGELAWVWPVATMILFPMLFFRRNRK